MTDFDAIRDKTLLFFLDHLMGKGSSRTLHDLSCQFGAKGFTKEMRQIAGGSQAGLKKFLSQFPSLFTIEDDNVCLTPLTNDQNDGSIRDYNSETIDFFVEKLKTYGNAEVPLKSLFGHRSQASSKVRHVSGQNVKEFKEFLAANSNVFVVREDYVVLQSVLDQLEQDGYAESSLMKVPEEISYDPYLMQQLVNELEKMVYDLTEKYSSKISIDLLFRAIQTQSKQQVLWKDFVKVPSDLATFLQMNSRRFLVQANQVSLTNERLAVLRVDSTNENQNDKIPKQKQVPENSGENCEKKPDSSHSTLLEQSSNNPTVVKPSNQQHRVSSSSNKTTSETKSTSSQHLTVNQRIRSQIIDIVSKSWQMDSIRSTNENNANDLNSLSSGGDFSSPYYSFDLQTIKPRIIIKNKECELIIDEIMKNCSEVAFDLEGVNIGQPNTEVTLIQISYINNTPISSTNILQVILFDVYLNPELIDSGLRILLESDQLVKVGHDVRINSVSLYRNYGITIKNVFDTQVAHLILQQQTTGRPAYKPTKYISFVTLCSLYGGLNLNPKWKDRLHKYYRKDNRYWKNRPFSEEMVQFAIVEVFALLPTVYQTMRSQIKPEYEMLLTQLVYDSVFAYINSDEIKQRKRQRKFELELADLKLKLFNNDKKKIVLSNREIRLLRYIDLTDEIKNKIEGPLNVAKKLKRFETSKMPGKNGSTQSESRKPKDGLETFNSDDSDESDDQDEDDVIEVASSMNHDHEDWPSSRDQSGEYNSNSLEFFSNMGKCCHCHCHSNGKKQSMQNSDETTNGKITTTRKNSLITSKHCDNSTQTISTGDIVMTNIFT